VFAPREKIRIVLEGFGHEAPIRELCRREAVRPSVHYASLKHLMEAGKGRLQHDTVRDATRAEVEELNGENLSLKQLAVLVVSNIGITEH